MNNTNSPQTSEIIGVSPPPLEESAHPLPTTHQSNWLLSAKIIQPTENHTTEGTYENFLQATMQVDNKKINTGLI